MKKVVTVIAIAAILTTLLSTAALAFDSAQLNTPTVSETENGTVISVTGTLTGSTNGEVTVMAVRSEEALGSTWYNSIDKDAIMYIDQKAATAGEVNISFKLRETSAVGSYITIFMGGTNIDSCASTYVLLAEQNEEVIQAEDIQIVNGAKAFSSALGNGYSLAIITADNVDPATQSLKIGEKALYYSPQKGYFVGLLQTNDGEAIAADAEVVDEPSEVIYYGKVSSPSSTGKVGNADVARTKKIVLKKGDAPTEKQLIAADVAGATHDGKVGNADMAQIKKKALNKISTLPILADN